MHTNPEAERRHPDVSRGGYVEWASAWSVALYGPAGFYRRPEGPAGHFRTAVHAAPAALARAVGRLAEQSGCRRVVDVGAGRGELLTALAAAGTGLELHGCDVVDRPAGLPAPIGWSRGLSDLLDEPAGAVLDDALVIGWELLDVVPCPVVEVDADGLARVLLVEPTTGRQRLGGAVNGPDADWLTRWWPLDSAPPGSRAEIGAPRDTLWARLATRCAATPHGAVLLAVDYAHSRQHRPGAGSLAAFRAGRCVDAVPDGSCDLTAHVAVDAVAAALEAVGAQVAAVRLQRDVLRDLGVGAPTPLPLDAPGPTLLQALADRSAVGELLDPAGLGGFSWLLAGAGRPVPAG